MAGDKELKDMQKEVAREAADRDNAQKSAQDQQKAADDTPDTKQDFKDAELDAMADAADEGQKFHK